MKAMVLERPGGPLQFRELPRPTPKAGEVLIEIQACAVCRTDLHVIDGDLPSPRLPLIPGHEIVGIVAECGAGSDRYPVGTRVGVPWLGWTCGSCGPCQEGRENLCAHAEFTGYTRNGGYADACVADVRYCFRIPEVLCNVEAAPLLCAGLIGHRSYRKVGPGQRLGLYGFGAAAHVLVQIARFHGRDVFAFTRSGDTVAQQFALELGAVWAGDSETLPPEPLDGAIIFAPVGALIPRALAAVKKGGTVVCGGIHMSDIPSFPYRLLWEERTLTSVANLTRADGEELLELAAKIPIRTETEVLPLTEANEALARLREGRLRGAVVLVPAL